MKGKAVIFDLDGTLVDTSEFIYQAYEFALISHKLDTVKRETLAPMIGQGLKEIYQTIAPTGNPQSLVDAHFNFQQKSFKLIKSFPKVTVVLKKLKKLGFKMAIVTSRMRNTVMTLNSAGIDEKLFDVIITADLVTKPKPHPQGVKMVLKNLNIKPENAVIVGDGIADIEMGKKAKIKTIGVTYGFGGENIKKSKPDLVIDQLEELLKVLKYT